MNRIRVLRTALQASSLSQNIAACARAGDLDAHFPEFIEPTLATAPLPPIPGSKTWFTLTPNDVVTALYSDGGDKDARQKELDAIASPPAADPDPISASKVVAEVISGFVALPTDLIAADIPEIPISEEGAGLDELVS